METVSVVIESLNPSSSIDESIRELEPSHGSDNQEADQEEESENTGGMKLVRRKESDDEEAHEDDGYDAPASPEIRQALDPTWMASIKEKRLREPTKIQVSSTNTSTSIHRVPDRLLQQDKNAYIPHVVSIGPLHYNERGGRLQAMEEHKWRYLNGMVTRKGEAWFEQCMVAVKKLEKEARRCYSEVIELDSNSFVEMMVLDSFFIVELFRKKCSREFKGDPIFELKWLNLELTQDLIMLENQIPFSILQTLFERTGISSFSLQEAALKFFCEWFSSDDILCKIERTGRSNLRIHHLLHLLHSNIVLSTTEKKRPASVSVIPCASKLKELGIKFKKRDRVNDVNFLDIKFEKGVIEIPRITIHDATNLLFRNLIAFEECNLCCKKYITTYTCFMDSLIDSRKDVEILVQNGIIKNYLDSDKGVALLFNDINKNVTVTWESFYLSGACKEINQYCGTTWPKLRATLMHDYFKNPWAIVSFTAAVFLLLLAFTQAFFSSFPKFAVGN